MTASSKETLWQSSRVADGSASPMALRIILTLQKALRIAVEKEQFEEAARLRDMLQELDNEENSDA